MKPLEMNIRICESIGLFTLSEDFKAKFLAFISNGVLTSNVLFLVIISSAYCFKNISDVEQATYAFYVIAAGLISLTWNGVVLIQRDVFKNLLLELQQIITKSEYTLNIYDLLHIFNSVFTGLNKNVAFNYDKVEIYVQWFTKNHIIVFVIADLSSMILMPVLVAAFNYYNGTYDYTVWYLPLVTM